MLNDCIPRRLCLTTVVGFVLGGCLNSSDTIPGLSQIYIRNEREIETELSVTIIKNGDIMYDERTILEASTDDSWGEFTLEKPWLGESVPYEVIVDSPDINENNYTTEDFLEMGGDSDKTSCFKLTIVIEEDIVDFRPSVEEKCY